MPSTRANTHEIRYAVTLSGVIALRMMGLFLILPVFMLLAVEVPGYTPLAAGVAMGIYGLTQAALQQPFGWLSDRWGRRPVLLLALGGCGVLAMGGDDAILPLASAGTERVDLGGRLVVPGFIPTPLGEIFEYSPTTTELMISLGIWGIGLLVFTLLAKATVAIELGDVRYKPSVKRPSVPLGAAGNSRKEVTS